MKFAPLNMVPNAICEQIPWVGLVRCHHMVAQAVVTMMMDYDWLIEIVASCVKCRVIS